MAPDSSGDPGERLRPRVVPALGRQDPPSQRLRIVEELDEQPWGIRRFSLLDPSGARVTVLAHTDPT